MSGTLGQSSRFEEPDTLHSMTNGEDKENKPYLAMNPTDRRMHICAGPMDKGNKRAYEGKKSENRQPTRYPGLLLPQTLNPRPPAEMQIQMPNDVGEKQAAYNHVKPYPQHIAAACGFELHA